MRGIAAELGRVVGWLGGRQACELMLVGRHIGGPALEPRDPMGRHCRVSPRSMGWGCGIGTIWRCVCNLCWSLKRGIGRQQGGGSMDLTLRCVMCCARNELMFIGIAKRGSFCLEERVYLPLVAITMGVREE